MTTRKVAMILVVLLNMTTISFQHLMGAEVQGFMP